MACIGRFREASDGVWTGRAALIRQQSSLEVNFSQSSFRSPTIGTNPLTLKRNSYPTKPHRHFLALLALPIAAPLFIVGWALTTIGERRGANHVR